MSYDKWLNTVEVPISRDDKYFYQIIVKLNKIIELLESNKEPKFVKPIGTKDEPNEEVTVEFIHEKNIDEFIHEENIDEILKESKKFEEMRVVELRDIAKDFGIKNYTSMRKDELVNNLYDYVDKQ